MPGIQVGAFEIACIADGQYWWDGGVLFGVVPKTLWSRAVTPDERNLIPLAFNCYLVRTPEHNVLLDTGGGGKMDARARERMNMPAVTEALAASIARAGFDPASIDIVINSHLHWDHSGGNTVLTPSGAQPAFPKARYFAPRGEWEHAHERLIRDSISYLDDNYDPLVNSGQMTLVDGDCEIVPGVWMRRAPGHTRDMAIVTAASGGGTFCFLSDLAPMAAHVQPTWVTAFDLYPLETIESKLRWFAEAADHQWICGFGHEVHMPFARIERDARGRFAAVPPK